MSACQGPGLPEPRPRPDGPSEARIDPVLEASMPDPTPHDTAPDATEGPQGAEQAANGPEPTPTAHKPPDRRTGPRGEDCTYCFPDEHRHPQEAR